MFIEKHRRNDRNSVGVACFYYSHNLSTRYISLLRSFNHLKDLFYKHFNPNGFDNLLKTIKLFYRVVKLEKNLPFDAKIPNDETLQAIKDAEDGKNLTACDDGNDLLRKLHA